MSPVNQNRGLPVQSGPRFCLAPMDGMTHASFRSICFDYGCDGATTEMIQSLALGRAKKPLSPVFSERLVRCSNEKDLAAQLIGSIPSVMGESARRLTALGRFDAIDINMGCPAKKVVGSGNGAALLKDVSRAVAVMSAVRDATSLPVRLKLRLGWDREHMTAAYLVQSAHELGFQSVTLHGRTRSQMYAEPVDTAAIHEICKSTEIPIYANGGVTCAADALSFLEQTGAFGVAIGRAALKNPWIFDDIARLRRGEAPVERRAPERVSVALRLARRACEHRPEHVAIREMRKFCSWLLAGLSGRDALLHRLNTIDSLFDFSCLLEDYLDRLVRENDLEVHAELVKDGTLDTVRR